VKHRSGVHQPPLRLVLSYPLRSVAHHSDPFLPLLSVAVPSYYMRFIPVYPVLFSTIPCNSGQFAPADAFLCHAIHCGAIRTFHFPPIRTNPLNSISDRFSHSCSLPSLAILFDPCQPLRSVSFPSFPSGSSRRLHFRPSPFLALHFSRSVP
jgi:hypothetical protein